jgi:hypothetical protein
LSGQTLLLVINRCRRSAGKISFDIQVAAVAQVYDVMFDDVMHTSHKCNGVVALPQLLVANSEYASAC